MTGEASLPPFAAVIVAQPMVLLPFCFFSAWEQIRGKE